MVGGGEVFRRLPLDFYHIFGLGGWGQRISQCGMGMGDYRPESGGVGLTEIVERMLSVRDVGGFPPPMAIGGQVICGWLGTAAAGDRRLIVPEGLVARSSATSALVGFAKFKMKEEQSFDSIRITGE
jgi:hypothetical protein